MEEAPSLKAHLYPNPTEGAVTLTFELPEVQVYQVQCFDGTGRAIKTQKGEGKKGENQILLDLGPESPGLYVVKLSAGKLQEIRRVILQR